MATGLIDIMKRAALDASDDAKFADLRYGTVVSTKPLKVQITNQFVIPASMLVVPKHLTNYKVNINLNLDIGAGGRHKHTYGEDNKETSEVLDHTHKITGGNSITIENALKVGDRVALIRKQGGQSYFILDKI